MLWLRRVKRGQLCALVTREGRVVTYPSKRSGHEVDAVLLARGLKVVVDGIEDRLMPIEIPELFCGR